MPARDRRTDDYTEEAVDVIRGGRDTVKIDPPVLLQEVGRRGRSVRPITVHEGPVHRNRVGIKTPVPLIGEDALKPLILDEDEAPEPIPMFADLEPGEPTPSVPAGVAKAAKPPRSERPTNIDIQLGDDGAELRDDENTAPELPVVELPLRRAPVDKPKIILGQGIQDAVVAHKKDRSAMAPTQEMTPLAPIANSQWQTTDVSPMPVAPRPPAPAGSRWTYILSGALVLATIAAAGGYLMFESVVGAAGGNGGSATEAPDDGHEAAPKPPVGGEPKAAVTEEPEAPVVDEAVVDEAVVDETGVEEAGAKAEVAAPKVELEHPPVPKPAPKVAEPEPVEPEPAADSDAAAEAEATRAGVESIGRASNKAKRARDGATHVVHQTAADEDAPWLALRGRPRTSSKLRVKMTDGTRVKVYRLYREWARIRILSGPSKGRRGWAHSRWLDEL